MARGLQRLLALILFGFAFSNVNIAWSAQIGGGGTGGQSFSCPPNEEVCRCDGTYTDCKEMKDLVCLSGRMDCYYQGGKQICACYRKGSAQARPVAPRKDQPTLRQPTLKN